MPYNAEAAKRKNREQKEAKLRKLCSHFPFAYCHYPPNSTICEQCHRDYKHSFQIIPTGRPHTNHRLGDSTDDQ